MMPDCHGRVLIPGLNTLPTFSKKASKDLKLFGKTGILFILATELMPQLIGKTANTLRLFAGEKIVSRYLLQPDKKKGFQ